jgi:hypothetical protein
MEVRIQNNALPQEFTLGQNYAAPKIKIFNVKYLKIKVNGDPSCNYESRSVIQAFPVLQLRAFVLSTCMGDVQCPVNGE